MSGWTSNPTGDIARRAVFDWLKETDPGAFAPQFEHPADLRKNDEPAPLAAARAARELGRAMQRLVVAHALRARSVGESWQDVAIALDVQHEGGPDGTAAYLTTLGVRSEDPWWSPAHGVVWTCSTCEQAVRDYGPESGGPDDRESGHEWSCSRHVADVLAWEALWS